jgi:predicted amidohydrolase
MNLVALQFETTDNFDKNLCKLVSLIQQTQPNDFILAPELALNGYAYENMDDAVAVTQKAIPLLTQASNDRTIALTMTTKEGEKYFNTLYIFSYGKIVHTQSKHKLFTLGDEEKYFTSGNQDDIKIIDINGIRVATLICFELRFTELWDRLKGSDIILVPAMWGKIRKEHYEALTKALAIANQCYVIASDSPNDDMASGSGIITPFGEETRDDDKELISQEYDKSLIKKMRRYLNIGI